MVGPSRASAAEEGCFTSGCVIFTESGRRQVCHACLLTTRSLLFHDGVLALTPGWQCCSANAAALPRECASVLYVTEKEVYVC